MWLRPFCWLILALLALPAYADPILGSAGSFGVLGGSAVTNTGPTTINGDLGVYPGTSITNTNGITINGTAYSGSATPPNNAGAATAQSDATTAYNGLAGMSVTTNLTGEDLGGLTLTPGVYKFDSSADLTGTLTLNGEGNENALWVFIIGSTLTTASGPSAASVNVIDAGSNDGIFWDVGSSATLGTATAFEGNILASASITLDTGSSIGCGSALASTGAVTLDDNTITTGCSGGGTITNGVVTAFPYAAPVPEPGSMALLGSGLFALAGQVRRKLRK
jgi:type VI secretion system secreted protein VgrG